MENQNKTPSHEPHEPHSHAPHNGNNPHETQQSKQPEQSQQPPGQSTPPANSSKKVVLIGLLLILVAGTVAYLFATGKLFKGEFLAEDEKAAFKKIAEEISKAEGANYSVEFKDKKSAEDGQTRKMNIKVEGPLSFQNPNEKTTHTVTISGGAGPEPKPETPPAAPATPSDGQEGNPADEPQQLIKLAATYENGKINFTWENPLEKPEDTTYYFIYKGTTEKEAKKLAIANTESVFGFAEKGKKGLSIKNEEQGIYFYSINYVKLKNPLGGDTPTVEAISNVVPVTVPPSGPVDFTSLPVTIQTEYVQENNTNYWLINVTDPTIPASNSDDGLVLVVYEIWRSAQGTTILTAQDKSSLENTIELRQDPKFPTFLEIGKNAEPADFYNWLIIRKENGVPVSRSDGSMTEPIPRPASAVSELPQNLILVNTTNLPATHQLGFGLLDNKNMADNYKVIGDTQQNIYELESWKFSYDLGALGEFNMDVFEDGEYTFGAIGYKNEQPVVIAPSISVSYQGVPPPADPENPPPPPPDPTASDPVPIPPPAPSPDEGDPAPADDGNPGDETSAASFDLAEPFASVLSASVLPETDDEYIYEESITGSGTLTRENGKVTGEIVITDTYQIEDGDEITANITVKYGECDPEAIAGSDPEVECDPEVTVEFDPEVNDDTGFFTEENIRTNVVEAFSITEIAKTLEKTLPQFEDAVKNKLASEETLSAVEKKTDGSYELGLEKLYPEVGEENPPKISIGLDSEKKKLTELSVVFGFGNMEYKFLVKDFKIPEKKPASGDSGGGGAPVIGTPLPSGGGGGGGGGAPVIGTPLPSGGGGGGPSLPALLKMQEDKKKASADKSAKSDKKTDKKADKKTGKKSKKVVHKAAKVSPYEDVNEQTKGYEAILRLSEQEIVAGYQEKGKTLFKPNKQINRAETAKLILKGACVEPRDSAKIAPKIYNDVAPGMWFFPLTKEAFLQGYFTGYKEKDTAGNVIKEFRPHDIISQAELVKVLLEIFRREGYLDFEVKKSEPWFKDYMSIAQNFEEYWTDEENAPARTSLLEKDEVKPAKLLSRAEAAILIDRMVEIFGSCE